MAIFEPGSSPTQRADGHLGTRKQALTRHKRSQRLELGLPASRKVRHVFVLFISLPHVCAKLLSHIQLFGTPWTAAHQAPLSMGLSREEYWGGLPFPFSGVFSTQGWNPSPAVCYTGGQVLYHSTTWKVHKPPRLWCPITAAQDQDKGRNPRNTTEDALSDQPCSRHSQFKSPGSQRLVKTKITS